MPESVVHSSPYSGTWYPDDAAELETLLNGLWESSRQRTGPDILPGGLGFVVPHAGLIYSGTVAAAAYRHIERQQPERTVLLGFCHRGSPPGVLIPDVEGFQTPLGQIEVDRAAVAELLAYPQFRHMRESRLCDHSVELQLPLLYKAARSTRVVPLYVGSLDAPARAETAARLAEWAQDGCVFVASSDLTHYGSAFHYLPFPVNSRTQDRLRELDHEVMDAAGSLKDKFFLETLRRTSETVCGHQPISLLLAILQLLDPQEEVFQKVLDYQTSGEITGDFHHSVSYGALGYFPHKSFELPPREQESLIELARQTLRSYQATGRRSLPDSSQGVPETLEKRCGVFVTLRANGQLRGCLGRTAAVEPLKAVVPELTLAAALEDRRFKPVSPSESGIEIEISLLTPMKRILEKGQFRINVHGAFLKTEVGQGLLLPQVAAGRNWSGEQFLDALTRKAGVGTQAYSDPAAELYVFRAQIIE